VNQWEDDEMDKRQKEYEGVEKEVIVTADRSSNTGYKFNARNDQLNARQRGERWGVVVFVPSRAGVASRGRRGRKFSDR
jgi:hypothetical protein